MLDEKDVETIRKVVSEEVSFAIKTLLQSFAEVMAREMERIKKLRVGPK